MNADARPRPPSLAITAEEFEARRAQVHAMGGPAKLAARREAGILNARERIDRLCDPGSWIEIDSARSPSGSTIRRKSRISSSTCRSRRSWVTVRGSLKRNRKSGGVAVAHFSVVSRAGSA